MELHIIIPVMLIGMFTIFCTTYKLISSDNDQISHISLDDNKSNIYERRSSIVYDFDNHEVVILDN